MSKYPKGLHLLFFTEMWERFGYYVLQTIIVLYMSKGLNFSDKKADLVYGVFSAMLYLTPPIGGYLADKFLGFQRAIIIGGIILMVGYIFTALPSEQLFFYGLSILIIGNGLFKPNVSSIVGSLYEPNDSHRDAGFTIFYMGINIGAVIPPLFIGGFVAWYGWHSGLFTAALGMLIGILTFIIGRARLQGKGQLPAPSLKFYSLFYSGLVISIFLLNTTFRFPLTTDTILAVITTAIIVAVIYFLLQESKQQRNKMIAALILILISIGFWALYNQTFTSLMLYASRNMQHSFLGIHIDAEFTQFFNPFFILLLSPFLSKLWLHLADKNKNPSIPVKFSFGVLLMALGFIVIGLASKYFGVAGKTSPWWLALSYFLQTVGELLLSPIGLAMITVLSPEHLVGMMMGVWFLATSFSFVISSGLAIYAAVPVGTPIEKSLAIYGHAFSLYGYLALGLAFISFMLVPFLNKLITAPQ